MNNAFQFHWRLLKLKVRPFSLHYWIQHELEWDTKKRTDTSVQVARRRRWGGQGKEEEAVEEGWREGGVGICKWKVINFANLPNLSLLHRRGGKHWNGEKKRRNQNKEPTQTNCWDLCSTYMWTHARTHTRAHISTQSHTHAIKQVLFVNMWVQSGTAFLAFLWILTHWQQTLCQHVKMLTPVLTHAVCKVTQVVVSPPSQSDTL